MSELPDTLFALPGVDDPASTEVGIILLGLDARRLVAGLGLAGLADDPALVTLAVDRLRHGALRELSEESLVESGLARWRRVRPGLEAAGPIGASGALRVTWGRAERLVATAVEGLGPASVAYLTACWLRRDDIDAVETQGEL
ncbi:MAG TPA: DUF6187 family protein [Pseudonocardiaceae bacterium]|nr:DUF6187 family protein [Pseudonocardiaceae bacterium]